MKIGLMGCEFSSPNKGCEALTYSIISILNTFDFLKSETIIYNYSGTDLGDIPKQFPNFSFINIKPNMKDMTFKFIRSLKKCDIILDATMGDSFSDIYSEEYFNRLVRNKIIAEKCCKNYILLPQTYGPFNSNESLEKAKKVFQGAKKIYSRDELSKQLLESKFNIKNVELTSDMAFVLPYDKGMFNFNLNNKIKLGINISGLLYKGGFNNPNQFDLKINYEQYIESVIKYYSEDEDYEVHIIPHVIDLSDNAHDDDYRVCEEMQKKYPKCILAPKFKNPIEAKSYIANMNVFIGSRMHSTIAAFSTGVATIPVSYSRKFEGLFNSLEYEYVINSRTESLQSAFNKTIEYINNNDDLKSQQEMSMKIVEKKNKNFIVALEKNLKEIRINR